MSSLTSDVHRGTTSATRSCRRRRASAREYMRNPSSSNCSTTSSPGLMPSAFRKRAGTTILPSDATRVVEGGSGGIYFIYTADLADLTRPASVSDSELGQPPRCLDAETVAFKRLSCEARGRPTVYDRRGCAGRTFECASPAGFSHFPAWPLPPISQSAARYATAERWCDGSCGAQS